MLHPKHPDVISQAMDTGMNTLLKTLPLVSLLALATPLGAQTSTETVTEDEAPNAMALSMGEEEQPGLGDVYVESEFVDWELRCIRSEAEIDPCQLYQLLNDGNGNPIAEINIFPLIGQEAAAGATVVTPLETLLTENLRMSVDGGAAKVYPFSWCSQVGCFSRLGLSNDDIASITSSLSFSSSSSLPLSMCMTTSGPRSARRSVTRSRSRAPAVTRRKSDRFLRRERVASAQGPVII